MNWFDGGATRKREEQGVHLAEATLSNLRKLNHAGSVVSAEPAGMDAVLGNKGTPVRPIGETRERATIKGVEQDTPVGRVEGGRG